MASQFTIVSRTVNGNVVPALVPPNAPADWFSQSQPAPLTLVLPYLNGVAAAADPSKLPVPAKSQLFSLAWDNVTTLDGKFLTIATISIAATPANVDDGSLLADFLAFRQSLDAWDTSSLAPDTAAVAAERLARAVPARYEQVLSFAYAFDPVRRCIDLLPGMRLAVIGGVYELVTPNSTRNGYVGSGIEYMFINRRPDGTLGFDPFTDNIKVMQSADPTRTPYEITGPADLALQGNRFPYFRLVYPAQLDPVNPSTGGPNPYNYNSPVLIGATDLATLETATTAWLANQSSPPNNSRWLGFSGRAVVVPEIFTSVNGYQNWVAVGSTYAGVLQHQFIVQAYELAAVATTSIRRWASGTTAKGVLPLTAFQVSLPSTAGALAANWGDLPLLHGDQVTNNPVKGSP
jgi:hypothetical protein